MEFNLLGYCRKSGKYADSFQGLACNLFTSLLYCWGNGLNWGALRAAASYENSL